MFLALVAAASLASTVDAAAHKFHFHGVVNVERLGGDWLAVEPFERGYGMPPDTAFWVASISKSFTAVLVMRLVELGKMRLQDRVLGSGITVDELLTHTSGLPRSTYVAEGIADADEAARKILAQPRGEKGKFAYSNEGYTLLAIAAERAGGAPFFDLLRRHVLESAGLRHTGFWPTCVRGLRVAKLSRPPRGARARENWGFKGAEGICSTAQDLARFMVAVVSSKLCPHPERLFQKQVALATDSVGRGFFISANGT